MAQWLDRIAAERSFVGERNLPIRAVQLACPRMVLLLCFAADFLAKLASEGPIRMAATSSHCDPFPIAFRLAVGHMLQPQYRMQPHPPACHPQTPAPLMVLAVFPVAGGCVGVLSVVAS